MAVSQMGKSALRRPGIHLKSLSSRIVRGQLCSMIMCSNAVAIRRTLAQMGMSKAASNLLRSRRGAAATHPETRHKVKINKNGPINVSAIRHSLNGFQLTAASFGCVFVRWVGPGEERAGVKEGRERKKREGTSRSVPDNQIALNRFWLLCYFL